MVQITRPSYYYFINKNFCDMSQIICKTSSIDWKKGEKSFRKVTRNFLINSFASLTAY